MADAARVEKAFGSSSISGGEGHPRQHLWRHRALSVAQGVVDACKNMSDINVPIIVRLQGTNAEEAKKIIDESGLQVRSAILLKEAADAVADVLA